MNNPLYINTFVNKPFKPGKGYNFNVVVFGKACEGKIACLSQFLKHYSVNSVKETKRGKK